MCNALCLSRASGQRLQSRILFLLQLALRLFSSAKRAYLLKAGQKVFWVLYWQNLLNWEIFSRYHFDQKQGTQRLFCTQPCLLLCHRSLTRTVLVFLGLGNILFFCLLVKTLFLPLIFSPTLLQKTQRQHCTHYSTLLSGSLGHLALSEASICLRTPCLLYSRISCHRLLFFVLIAQYPVF